MSTVSWDAEGLVLVDIVPRVQTFNSDLYIQTYSIALDFQEKLTLEKRSWNHSSAKQRTINLMFSIPKCYINATCQSIAQHFVYIQK